MDTDTGGPAAPQRTGATCCGTEAQAGTPEPQALGGQHGGRGLGAGVLGAPLSLG